MKEKSNLGVCKNPKCNRKFKSIKLYPISKYCKPCRYAIQLGQSKRRNKETTKINKCSICNNKCYGKRCKECVSK